MSEVQITDLNGVPLNHERRGPEVTGFAYRVCTPIQAPVARILLGWENGQPKFGDVYPEDLRRWAERFPS